MVDKEGQGYTRQDSSQNDLLTFIPENNSIVSEIIRQNKPIILKKNKHHEGWGEILGERTWRGSETILGFPISFSGHIVGSMLVFAEHFSSPRPSGLTLYLDPDADANRIRDELQAALGSDRRLFISTNATLRGEVLRIFDSTFAITYALEAIAIAVSMFGIGKK